MYTGLSVLGVVVAGLLVMQANKKDSEHTDEHIRHTRQDIRLVSYLLCAILLMLGIIADRMH